MKKKLISNPTIFSSLITTNGNTTSVCNTLNNTIKHFLIALTLLLPFKSVCQEIPKVTLQDSSQLKLSSLHIDVKIIGNFASTTYDMQFYNELDRTLEGELAFPLGEGQAVSEFAMELNGQLRKAVVVEKELARRAFENTVRQNIDPGLLEKTQGNNYKARVYPILPKANKRIVLTYEQELSTLNKLQTFILPIGIQQKLDEFSVKIIINGVNSAPVIEGSRYKGLKFKETDNSYEAKITKSNLIPTQPIIVKIPSNTTATKVLTYRDYFYAHLPLEAQLRIKPKPQSITILWDTSYSMRLRQLDKELKLLDNYINYLQNIDIQFISFSNDIQINKLFKIKKGKWDKLKTLINEIQYDGGTSYEQFNNVKFQSDEAILFSDGLSNLGHFSANQISPLYTCCSLSSADHELLGHLATESGGQHLNLQRLSHTEALAFLKQETLQLIGFKDNPSISEVYPNKTNITAGFSITGRFNNVTNLELLLGYGGKVTQEIKILIRQTADSPLVKRLWAKQKLQVLNKNKELNKETIIALGKQYHLVTNYTSMLILDRIEDYVRYRIEPPHELKQEYKIRIKNIDEKEAYRLEELNDRKEELLDDYLSIASWYETTYPKKNLKPVKKIDHTPPVSNEQDIPQTTSYNQQSTNHITTPTTSTSRVELDPSKRIVSGTVVGSAGEAIPGVTVMIKGTIIGTITDMQGHYAINAEEGDELVFSFIGFKPNNHTVDNGNKINIALDEDECHLDEVMVVGYGVTRKSMITGSITTVISEELMSTAPGIEISEDGSSDSGTITTNQVPTQPMYIVDGVISNQNPMLSLKPEEIDGIEVLKAESASKIYGSRASNGLLIITTKQGRVTNKSDIEAFNKKIVNKIELKAWNPDTPYINLLNSVESLEKAYHKYLEIRDEYSNSPSFYLDVADFFEKKGGSAMAITVLTNLIEVKLDNHELMRALAYKLEYFKKYQLAAYVYEKVLELRPEEPQSYRDLALAYEEIGEVQKSFDLLYKLYIGELLEKDEDERFYGIEHIAYVELCRLINKYPKQLNLRQLSVDQFPAMPLDIRVVIDWNHNDTDIDIWVTDPNNEKAHYKHTETQIGGHISEDLTEGYGPEEFMLKKAIKGKYKIVADYYSDNLQKISGPTILKASIYTNYGKINEQKQILIFRLDKEEAEIVIGNIEINETN
ncbi:VIT domain-containing protein [Carboxylicivirga marina]|uniref:VIT domain-containing protein n=1 Tax=Carboxylicivirga marina TaxID=2800988 RepID=UPI0025926D42|nr:VIT domain-containing protein [uncultured Carboxylicivirga sp.]